MSHPLRPLLPAYGPRRDPPSQPPRKAKAPVNAACFPCRGAKTKCNGARPTCARCESRGEMCRYDEYVGDSSTTRMEGLKRMNETLQSEVDQLQARFTQLQTELDGLRELYQHLRAVNQDEALAILHRIRTTDDPLEVLEAIRASQLLLSSSNSAHQPYNS